MMDGSLFSFYGDGEFVGTWTTATSTWVSSTSMWEWHHSSNLFYDRVVVVIQGDLPASLIWHQTYDINMQYEGSFDDYHMYSTGGYNIGDKIQLISRYSSDSYHVFNLVSCIGYISVSDSVSRIDFGTRYWDGQADVWSPVLWRRDRSLPQFFGNSGDQYMDPALLYVEFDPSDFSFDYCKSFTALLRTVGTDPTFTACILDSSGDVTAVLDDITFSSIGDTYSTNDLLAAWHQVTVDLSGYDLSDKTIQFQIGLSTQHQVFNIGLYDIRLEADTSVEPNFWGKLWLWLSDIKDSIDKLAGNNVDTSGADSVDQSLGTIQGFESQYQDSVSADIDSLDVSFNFASFGNALALVSTYTTRAFMGLGDVSLLYYLPITLGIVLFICSRTPGNIFRDSADSKVAGSGRSKKDYFNKG